MKTFIRRPGNKTRYLKHIIPLIPKFTGTYYEPFLGTGAVYLHLLPPKAVLNDLNADIINIWRLVRDDPKYLITEINKFKKKFLHLSNNDKLKMCKRIVSKMDTYSPKTRTVMYLLMLYCSYAGTLINSKGEWYVSGLYVSIYNRNTSHIFNDRYVSKIRELSKILRSVKVYNQDYNEILKKTKKGDFVFLDPPYVEKRKYIFNYNKNETFEPLKLQRQLKLLDARGVKWMMTQIDMPQVRDLFKGYRFYNYINNNNPAIRGISSKKEIIIMNY